MIALHKNQQMNTGEPGELVKLKDIGIRTNENELAMKGVKQENENQDSDFQSSQIWNSSAMAQQREFQLATAVTSL